MASSGTIRPLFGVIIRDKCKYADVNTLSAYKTVAEDLLKDHTGPDLPTTSGTRSRNSTRRSRQRRNEAWE